MKNSVTSDCEGYWYRHLNAVQSILTIFALFYCLNYLQWCPLYLEDMSSLLETAPEILQVLLQDQFVVKRSPVMFKTVAADQSHEQTINPSQKSSDGIIYSMRKKYFVPEREMLVCLISLFTSQSTIFSYDRMGLPGLNQY